MAKPHLKPASHLPGFNSCVHSSVQAEQETQCGLQGIGVPPLNTHQSEPHGAQGRMQTARGVSTAARMTKETARPGQRGGKMGFVFSRKLETEEDMIRASQDLQDNSDQSISGTAGAGPRCNQLNLQRESSKVRN